MSTVPFALSIHKFINSIGADVGFASIIAVALLVLLYFAHAREAATLRDRLEEAHARIGGLESRLMQLLNAQSAAQRGRGPVPPPPGLPVPAPVTPGAPGAPGAARPPGSSAIPSVRRIPTATPAAALVAAGVAPDAGGLAPVAPLGVGGPALASATKVIPTALPAAAPPPAPRPELPALGAAANGHAPVPAPGDTRVLPSAPPPRSPLLPAPLPEPAVSAATLPPPVRIGADGPDRSRRRPPITPGSLLEEDFGGGGGGRLGRSGRLIPLLISGVAVIVIVVGLILITSSGSGSPATAVVQHTSTAPTGATVTNQKKTKAAPFVASKVQVSVLNGTAVAGLAGDLAKVLTGDGYKSGNVTNASVQTQASTVVYYVAGGAAGAGNKVAAQHVATALSLTAASVQPAPQSVIQSCSTGPTGNALGSCTANVIVSVGSDKASLASGNAG